MRSEGRSSSLDQLMPKKKKCFISAHRQWISIQVWMFFFWSVHAPRGTFDTHHGWNDSDNVDRICLTGCRHVALLQDEQTGFQNSFMKLERWREDKNTQANIEFICKCWNCNKRKCSLYLAACIIPCGESHQQFCTSKPRSVPGRSSKCAHRSASPCHSRSSPCRSGRIPSSGLRHPETLCRLWGNHSVTSLIVISVQMSSCVSTATSPPPLRPHPRVQWPVKGRFNVAQSDLSLITRFCFFLLCKSAGIQLLGLWAVTQPAKNVSSTPFFFFSFFYKSCGRTLQGQEMVKRNTMGSWTLQQWGPRTHL